MFVSGGGITSNRVRVAVSCVPGPLAHGAKPLADGRPICARGRCAVVPGVARLKRGSWQHDVLREERAPSCAGALGICSTSLSQPSSTPRAHQHPPVCMHGVAPKRRHKAQGLACSCLGGCVGPRRRGIGVAYPRMPARVRAPDPAWHPHLKHLPKSQASSRLHLCLSHRPGQVEASMERKFFGGRAPS